MPKKIVVTEYMSLDGVIQDPVGVEGSGLGNWTGPFSRGPEGDKFKLDELFAADSLIFGRATYDAFAAVWPTVNDAAGYAHRMNTLPKYVASTTLENAAWTNSTIWGGDLVEHVRELKSEPDGEALIFGSASIAHQLAAHALVDEYRLMVYPTVLGQGTRMFKDGTRLPTALVETRQFGGGIVLLRYQTARATPT